MSAIKKWLVLGPPCVQCLKSSTVRESLMSSYLLEPCGNHYKKSFVRKRELSNNGRLAKFLSIWCLKNGPLLHFHIITLDKSDPISTVYGTQIDIKMFTY